MKKLNFQQKCIALAVFASGAAMTLAIACGGDDNQVTPNTTIDGGLGDHAGTGGTGGTGGAGGTGGGDSSAGSGGTGGTGDGSAGTGGSMSEGGDAPTDTPADVPACMWDGGGCFPCTPVAFVDYLNACTGTGVDCTPFTGALPLLNSDGTRPALP